MREYEEVVSKETEISEKIGVKEILERLIEECANIRRVLKKYQRETIS